MPQIRPIKDLRNTNEISKLCHNQNEPIFITHNGYVDLVVMSIETYERELSMANIYKKIAVAEAQIKNKELLDGDEVFSKLRAKYGKHISNSQSLSKRNT